MKEWIISTWTDFVNWLTSIVVYVLDALKDLGLFIFEGILDALLSVINLITPPDFLSMGVQALVSSLDPSVLYLLNQVGFTEGLAMYSTAITFRLYRKLFTFGLW